MSDGAFTWFAGFAVGGAVATFRTPDWPLGLLVLGTLMTLVSFIVATVNHHESEEAEHGNRP